MNLYSYFRSSASWRVRIALALKNLPCQYHGVHLVRGEQLTHAQLGAAHLLPALWVGSERITQSLAILEYLEEAHPTPALLPQDPFERAYVRSLALDIACEIHPLNNLRVLKYLKAELAVDEEAKNAWYRHWVEAGLAVVEERLRTEGRSGRFCLGDTPGMADCVLVPQVFNAQRFAARIDHLSAVLAVFEACMALPAFAQTHPSQVPDAE
ncbi:maleylacetoacetate isomerase [Inhella sp. 4Y17]|uniref:Maleylacetoacetate isomerase n=1 Tax=Inhella gelatinilytica TaxID=2795030 RepID=A0A931IWV9_9BURK|nr:maleylacetoacetate isomerase [Inhella gelatinilytica]